MILLVKAIGDDLTQALTLAERVTALLNDAGDQDISDGDVYAGTDWRITTITLEQMVQFNEMVDGVRIYHAGGQYRIRMEGI